MKPWPDHSSSTLYLAFLKEAGAMQSVGHAIVTDWRMIAPHPSLQWICEIIERSVMFKGNGYGEELVLGYRRSAWGRMAATAVTPEGVKLLTKLYRPTDSFAATIEQISCASEDTWNGNATS